MSTNLSTTIGKYTLPLLATEVTKKDAAGNKVGTGKFWHTFRVSNVTMYGVPVPALDTKLPTSITIDGHKVDLVVAQQDESYTDRATKKVTVRKVRHLQAKATGEFHSTTLDEPRAYSVTITDTGDDVWNVTIKVTRVRAASASPESKQARAAATLATLSAFLTA